jgi:hypothetical protein
MKGTSFISLLYIMRKKTKTNRKKYKMRRKKTKTKTNRKKYKMRRKKTRRRKQRGGVDSPPSSPEEVVLRRHVTPAPRILPLNNPSNIPFGIQLIPNKDIGSLAMTNLANSHIYGYNPNIQDYSLRRWLTDELYDMYMEIFDFDKFSEFPEDLEET